jgi:hypothetical protein
LYHEECIVSWLTPKAQWLCPICRQEFIVPTKKQTSVSFVVATTAADRCSSSVCALSTMGVADHVSSMRSITSELGDPLESLDDSELLQDIEDQPLPPSSS